MFVWVWTNEFLWRKGMPMYCVLPGLKNDQSPTSRISSWRGRLVPRCVHRTMARACSEYAQVGMARHLSQFKG